MHSLAILVCSFVLAGAPQDDSSSHGLERWSGTISDGQRAAAEALRASRREQEDGARAKLAQQLLAVGREDAGALMEILVRARVPETADTDTPQILSAPQRAMVLAAMSSLPPERVRPLLMARLEQVQDDAVKLAAVHVYGAIGTNPDVAEACKLVPRDAHNQLTDSGRDALRVAVASILRRDTRTWRAISELLRTQSPEIQAALLDGAGEVGGASAFEFLFDAARGYRHLEQQAVALIRDTVKDVGAEDRRQCTNWMADAQHHARPEFVRSLLQTIGLFDDGTHIPELLERLADDDTNTREAAAWALRKLTGASYPTDSNLWNSWYAQEQRWMQRDRPRLCDSLCSSDRQVVSGALRQYAERRTFRDDLTLDLLPLLKRPEEDLIVRTCEVLARLNSPVAVESLLPLIDSVNPRVVTAARTTLEKITARTLPASSADAYAVLYPTR